MFLRMLINLAQVSPWFKRFLWRHWYQYLAGYKVADWQFMNYGYASLAEDAPQLELQAADEPNRYSIQLYHHVASRVSLTGLEALEVGSGRGGGASFVKRYLQPKQMTGVELSAEAVRFCRATHAVDGLVFVEGDAESLPFADDSFDAVINVESSHCYGSFPSFMKQVQRVLRPGGHFLFADLRSTTDRDQLHQAILDSGLALIEQEDITPNVLAALQRDSQRKTAMIQNFVGPRLLSTFGQFAGLEGSDIYTGFKNGTLVYIRYLLRK